MRLFDFKQVDVFTDRPYQGNPVAVVLGNRHLDHELGTAAMQRIASWTNLSETTFVLPASHPKADYQLRIFTPKEELPFAGHPTLGSAHAILESGLVKPEKTQLVQQCGAGLIDIEVFNRRSGQQIFLKSPKAQLAEVGKDMSDRLSDILNTHLAEQAPPCVVNIGPKWLIAQIDSEENLRNMAPEQNALSTFSKDMAITGITVFALSQDKETPVCVRSFAPLHGIPEDPVCGSGNASVGAYLLQTGIVDLTGEVFTTSQGRELNRNGFVSIKIDRRTESVYIGGQSVTCISGHIHL